MYSDLEMVCKKCGEHKETMEINSNNNSKIQQESNIGGVRSGWAHLNQTTNKTKQKLQDTVQPSR